MAYDDDYIPPIQFTPAGDSEEERDASLKAVKPSPGFPACAQILAEAIQKQSITTVLDFTPQQVSIRFQIDGLWHTGASMERETGDFMLATLKKIAGLEYRERRARQEGRFTTAYLKDKQKVRVVSQGIKTGERVAIYLDWKRPPMDTAEQLGMRPKMEEQLKSHLENREAGLILAAGIPGDGYTSVWRGMLDTCDRLTRDYFVLEEKNAVEEEVINIYSIEFDRAAGEDAMTPVPQLLLKQPDVLAFPELPDANLINQIVEMSEQKKMPIYARAPGKNVFDTLLRLLILKPDVAKLAERLTAVLAMRLIRKLCDDCKIGFKPHPKMLQKLGIPRGRVAELYKPFVFRPGMVDEEEKEIEPCTNCHGIGYKGRTGIFELLEFNSDLAQTLIKTPRMDRLMGVAQRYGHISMQHEGLVLVAKGITSIEELQRVLKA
jgi:type II secretory ATPase GspE/PulE/Tfp pilus assembly ATPase PilB-like protein